MTDNPIKYSDLISPDGSIEELIKQLKELKDVYGSILKEVREEAGKLSESLKNVSGATEEGRKTTQKAATDAEKLAQAQKKLEEAQSDVQVQIEILNQKRREAINVAKAEAKQANAAADSYDALSAQYTKMKIELNKMSKAEREGTEAGRKLEAQAKETYEEMKRLQEATGKTALNVGNYEEAIKNALASNNKFAASLLKLSDELQSSGGGMAALGVKAKALGTTLLGLMKNPVFLAIAGIAAVGAAGKFWYDYNKGVTEANKLTKQFTGLSGSALSDLRIQVQSVADAFDKDYREVLQATNVLAKQFGIDYSEAINLIKDGFIAGADINQQFIDQLTEYPAYFKEAGVSAEAFVAILTQAQKVGIYSDKGVDVIKEGNLRIREMTDATRTAMQNIGLDVDKIQQELQRGMMTTFDVMKMVSERLNELPETSAEVGAAIADIFGGPGEDAGLAYIKTLKDIETNLQAVKQQVGETAELQNNLIESQQLLDKEISEMFEVGGGFDRFMTNFKIWYTDVFSAFVNMLNSLFDTAEDKVRRMNAETQSNAIAVGKERAGTKTSTIAARTNELKKQGKSEAEALKQAKDEQLGVLKKALSNEENELKKHEKVLSELQEKISVYPWWGSNKIRKQLKADAQAAQQEVIDIKGYITSLNTQIDEITNYELPKKVQKKSSTSSSKGVSTQTTQQKERVRTGSLYGAEYNYLQNLINIDPSLTKQQLDMTIEQVRQFKEDLQREIDSNKINFLQLLGIDSKPGEEPLTATEKLKVVLQTTFNSIIDMLNTISSARVDAAERALEAAQRETDAAQSAYEAERQARANGYASDEEYAKKELDLAKKNEKEAEKRRQNALVQQQNIQSVQQASSLLTASALIWSQLGFPWAIPAIAAMWGSFAFSRVKANELTKQTYGDGGIEFLDGGSHASGNDIPLGTTKDGKSRRAEGGEALIIINKKNTSKYRSALPQITESLNSGTFEKMYGGVFNMGEDKVVNINLSRIENELTKIRGNQKNGMVVRPDGSIIEVKGNVRRVIK